MSPSQSSHAVNAHPHYPSSLISFSLFLLHLFFLFNLFFLYRETWDCLLRRRWPTRCAGRATILVARNCFSKKKDAIIWNGTSLFSLPLPPTYSYLLFLSYSTCGWEMCYICRATIKGYDHFKNGKCVLHEVVSSLPPPPSSSLSFPLPLFPLPLPPPSLSPSPPLPFFF